MKVLIVGDSPRLNTGFARVNQQAAKAFLNAGWEVVAAQALTNEPPPPDLNDGIRYYTPGKDDDMMGRKTALHAYELEQPDIVYLSGDPGLLVAWLAMMPDDAKILGYIPIEGEPVTNELWRIALQKCEIITCSKYGADVVKKNLGRDIEWAYHGVDHSIYRRLDNRDEIRKSIGWDDKFIITCVANNVRRKQIPRLMDSISMLKKKYKRDNVFLYVHAVPFQNHWLEGHNLIEIAAMYGISECVLFNSHLKKLHDYVPEYTGNPSAPGLVELYNASDLFVLPSQVEGFGLPIAEAMACGLPVMVTKYAAGWEVASPAGRGLSIRDWEVHKSGTLYANVDPSDMAESINKLIRNPSELQKMSLAGMSRAKDYTWEPFQDMLIKKAMVMTSADA
jgi:glycosyltransferase involved in cell wall biosynthesis